jgi:hypothetical protein
VCGTSSLQFTDELCQQFITKNDNEEHRTTMHIINTCAFQIESIPFYFLTTFSDILAYVQSIKSHWNTGKFLLPNSQYKLVSLWLCELSVASNCDFNDAVINEIIKLR